MDRLRHGTARGEIVDISRIPGLGKIEKQGNAWKIGAMVTIDQVANHPEIQKNYPGLAMSAGALATPQIRNAASIGGSLLQRNRCWYFRHEEFSCFKKGGNSCPAREGNHQFGVCFDLGPCVFPHPSTLGLALMAYGAKVEIFEKGSRDLGQLYGDGSDPAHDHQLKEGEILTSILLPDPLPSEKAAYFRNISRARAEWPLVEVIVRYRLVDGKISNASIGLGGVANVPMLLPKVAEFLNGKTPGDEIFKEAGKLGTEGANPLPQTQYKVEMVAGTIYETLRRAQEGIWGGEG